VLLIYNFDKKNRVKTTPIINAIIGGNILNANQITNATGIKTKAIGATLRIIPTINKTSIILSNSIMSHLLF